MTNEQHSNPLVSASFDRRGFFRIGGITLAAGAVIAACGDPAGNAGEIGRVGVGATQPTLADPVVDDSVLLRTSASIEQSIVDAYQHILDGGFLAQPSATFPDLGDQTELVTTFQQAHRQAAETYNQLAGESGAEPWTCGNPRLDAAFITPIFDRVEKGAAKTDTAQEIKPSEDPTRDMINLVVTLELLSAASAQALVPQVSQPSYRAEAMRLGARAARQAALVSLRINPGGYVTTTDAQNAGVTETTAAPTETTAAASDGGDTPQTEIPLPVAIPSQFGALSAITYVGGKGDENGVRLKFNFETPSLNSFVYPFSTCD